MLPNTIDAQLAQFKTHLLADYFRYDPLSGKIYYKKRFFGNNLTRRQKQWNNVHTDKEAGYVKDGYIRVSWNNKQIYAHQIAFAIMTGYIPKEIDHKDLNKSNNKWENLREAHHSQNASNCKKRTKNKSGLKGVSWSKSNNCWRMDISFNKIKYHSYHLTKEEAYKAYCEKSTQLHKEFGRVE